MRLKCWLSVVVFGLWGCSEEPGPDGGLSVDATNSDGGAADADPCSGPDSDNDGIADVCDPCPTIRNGTDLPPDRCTSTTEQEPNNSPENGTLLALLPVGGAAEIVGTIATGDQDYFRIQVDALTKLRVRLVRNDNSSLTPKLVVTGPGYTVPRELEGHAATREFLFVLPGVYSFLFADDNGSDAGAYLAQVQHIIWDPEPLGTLPVPRFRNMDTYQVDISAGEVPVFTYREGSDGRPIRVRQMPRGQSSMVDVVLVEYDPFALASNPDLPGILFEASGGEYLLVDYNLVIDHRRVSGEDRTVTIEIGGALGGEIEPNNQPEDATPLSVVRDLSVATGWGTMPQETAPEVDWFRANVPLNAVALWRLGGATNLNPLDSPGTNKSTPRFTFGKLLNTILTSTTIVEPPAPARDDGMSESDYLFLLEVGDGTPTFVRVTERRNDVPPYSYWSEFPDPRDNVFYPHYTIDYRILGELGSAPQTVNHGDLLQMRFDRPGQAYLYSIFVDAPSRLNFSEPIAPPTPDIDIRLSVFVYEQMRLWRSAEFSAGTHLAVIFSASLADTSTRAFSLQQYIYLEPL